MVLTIVTLKNMVMATAMVMAMVMVTVMDIMETQKNQRSGLDLKIASKAKVY